MMRLTTPHHRALATRCMAGGFIAFFSISACSTNASGDRSSSEDHGLPGLTVPSGQSGEGGVPVAAPSMEVLAALPHAWFHGEIVDVYPETEVGTTIAFQRSAGYEGELFQQLDTCSGVIPQLLIEVEVINAVGGHLPERVIFAVDKTWLDNRPVWHGYDSFDWDGREGGVIAPGQRIGGAAGAVSSRYGRARLYARPLLRLFEEDAEGRVRFQSVRLPEDHDDYRPPSPTFYPELETHTPESLLAFLANARESSAAPRGEELENLRRTFIGGVHDLDTDVWSSSFFPHCTPSDFEHPRVQPPFEPTEPPEVEATEEE